MSFLIQIVYGWSDHTFEMLTKIAEARDANEIERHENWTEFQSGEKFPDYRFIARFKGYLSRVRIERFELSQEAVDYICLLEVL